MTVTPRLHPGTLAAAGAVSAALHALVQSRMAGGAPPPDPFRGLHVDVSDVERMLARPFPEPTAAAPFALPPEAAGSPLDTARRGLGLSAFETAVLALCLLPEIDARYGQLIGFLHDDVTRKAPSVELALALFTPGGAASLDYLHAFTAEAPMRSWKLVQVPPEESLIRQPLTLDRPFLWFLLGDERVDPGLTGLARLLPPGQPATVLPPGLAVLLENREQGPPLLLYGEDEPTCVSAAAAAAGRAGRHLLLIEGGRLAEMETGPALLQRCLREAVLHGMLPCITRASALLQPSSARAAQCREEIMACPAQVLLVSQSLTGEIAYLGDDVAPVPVPALPAAERLAAWQAAAAHHHIAADERALLALAETTGISGAAVDEVAAVAAITATTAGETPTGRHLQLAARSALRQRSLSLTLSAPRFDWDDIILPEDRLGMLRHLCSRVRYRSQVRLTWGVGSATLPGVTALFAGQPGTGKSMAAEVVAADLGLDLCRIDLAQVVSKYIGETEKNLAGIFSEAEQSGVVLVFDEADALFGKRSAVRDSHDRYANVEISYLLLRMEHYRGLCILTTNLQANLDEAFTRRIAVSIDFPLPTPADRLHIWQRVLAAAPCAPDLDLGEMAERLELAGGAIVNVAVAAAHLAAEEKGVIDGDRLRRAVRWELQKMGRLMGADTLDALLPSVGIGHRNGRSPR